MAVLMTLLLTAVNAARKKSHQARCMANLHQISLALTMYLDDFQQRPPRFDPLVAGRYLAAAEALVCPQDRTGNWGGLVNGSGVFSAVLLPVSGSTNSWLAFSYLNPLGWDDTAWARLMKAGSLAGVATCQLHGLGQPNTAAPSIQDFEGLTLRAQRDGAVVQRKVFWASTVLLPPPTFVNLTPDMGTPALTPPAGGDYPWPLFVDELPPAP